MANDTHQVAHRPILADKPELSVSTREIALAFWLRQRPVEVERAMSQAGDERFDRCMMIGACDAACGFSEAPEEIAKDASLMSAWSYAFDDTHESPGFMSMVHDHLCSVAQTTALCDPAV
jgi:hypothetical protein